jgi:hypothetical protein
MRWELWLLGGSAVLALWACGGTTFNEVDGGGEGGSSSSGSSGGGSGGSSGGGSGGSSGSSTGSSSGSSSGGSSSGSGSGSSSGVMRVPVNHRTSDAECTQPAPPGNCKFMTQMCSSDSSCMAGTNGRCVQGNGGPAYCFCTYDTCANDAACATGQTCACHGSPYTYGTGNTCVSGNCRVDGDCGAGGYCSPSYQVMSCGGLEGYYCHTSMDQCVDDSDCPSGGGPPVCTYSTTNMRWECHTQSLCP